MKIFPAFRIAPLFLLGLILSGIPALSQKKVAASITLAGDIYADTLNIGKGKSFVVTLPVRNRAGDDWVLANPVVKCKFTESMLGQVGMLPNQEEPKLMFFKAAEKGEETIRFIYRNPKAPAGATPEERTLLVRVE